MAKQQQYTKQQLDALRKYNPERYTEVKAMLKEEKQSDKSNATKKEEQRSRKFSCVTYLPVEQLQKWLNQQDWLCHYAYAFHDKDVWTEDDQENDENHKVGTAKTPHTHLLLYTFCAKTSSAIYKRLKNFAEQIATEEQPAQNSSVQCCTDLRSMWRYLIHIDDPEKFQYSSDIRKTDSFVWWDGHDKGYGLNSEYVNNVGYTMLQDMMNGTSTQDMVIKYGKEYIYHAQYFKRCIADIHREQSIQAHQSLEEYFPLLLENSTFTQEQKNTFFMVLGYIKTECLCSYNSALNFYLEDEK